ncbi:cell adhesion molecule CEACAM3-like isoform X4 [Ovis canadensis]|uniref:cell adhesion molecule CEACAM3-like isoform X4 n=1 Tax=Ovis canadensis TaxID=37174 RepID=UPI0037511A55
MEPPSGSASRRHVPWSRLLLAVSLLTFWTPPTTAQPTIETVPPLAAEGSNVLLLAHNVSENPLGYAWHRGERVDYAQLIASYRVDTNATTNGPVYSRRETLYPNGTLLIRNVTQRDTGPYTLLITKNDLQTETLTGHLHIHRRENSRALGVGAITGIVIGVLLVLTLLAVLGCFIFLHRGKWPPASTSASPITGSGQRDCPTLTHCADPFHSRVVESRSAVSSLCDPMDCRLPGSSVHGFLQASLPDARPPAPIYQELVCPNTDVYCHISHKADVGL